MATYGLLPTGFSPKTIEIIIADLKGQIAYYFGTSVDTDNGVIARLIGIVAERYAELWELAEMIVSSQDADKATGIYQDAVAMLIGALRIEAAYSTVTLTLTGTPTTVVPAGQRIHTASTIQYFLTATSGTITAVSAWLTATAYTVGQRVTTAAGVYQCVTAGTSVTSPSGTLAAGTRIFPDTSGTLVWRWLGTGTGAIDVAGQAVTQGAVLAVSGDLQVIDTPVGGWTFLDNVLDATPGYDTQSDEAFRLTREAELSQAGTATADAIRAAILTITGVTSCTVFVNETDVTDGFGLTPHSVEALVRGGADTAIAAVLLAQVAAGIHTAGNTSATATDSQGNVHTIGFSRPVIVNIGASLLVTKDPAVYPTNGDLLVKQAIVAAGNARLAGYDAVSSAVLGWAFTALGVLDVPALPLISSALAPSTPATPTVSTTITITSRQLANYDTSFITVTSSNGTP